MQKLDDLWHELQHYTAPIPVTNTPPPPDKHIYDDLEEYESVFTSVSVIPRMVNFSVTNDK